MPTNILVAYYSAFGHVFDMARSVAEGARGVAGADLRLRRFPELAEVRTAMAGSTHYAKNVEAQRDVAEVTHDDLRWADGICWGTPTRYGNMIVQMSHFLGTTGQLWLKGELEMKAAGVFTSTSTIHGGQEATVLTSFVPLLHLGMVLVGTSYGENPQILTTDGIGSSPYGAGTLAGPDNSRQPDPRELTTARNLGSRVARVAGALKPLRAK
jgi:NAD(P)H dehydrogenase (quinone)